MKNEKQCLVLESLVHKSRSNTHKSNTEES